MKKLLAIAIVLFALGCSIAQQVEKWKITTTQLLESNHGNTWSISVSPKAEVLSAFRDDDGELCVMIAEPDRGPTNSKVVLMVVHADRAFEKPRGDWDIVGSIKVADEFWHLLKIKR